MKQFQYLQALVTSLKYISYKNEIIPECIYKNKVKKVIPDRSVTFIIKYNDHNRDPYKSKPKVDILHCAFNL